MPNQKGVQIFLSLSEKERNEFKKVLRKQTVKGKENYSLKFFEKLIHILKNEGEYKLSQKTPAELSKKAFGNELSKSRSEKSKRDQRFKTFASQITQYLLNQKTTEDEVRYKLLLQIYKERGLDNFACNLAESKIKEIEVIKRKHLSHYQDLIDLNNFLYSYPIADQNRDRKYVLEKVYYYESIVAALKMLMQTCSLLMKNMEYESDTNKSEKYLKQSQQMVGNYQLENEWEVKLYLQAAMLLGNLTHRAYQDFRELFDEYQDVLSKESNSRLLKYLINTSFFLYLKSPHKDYYFEQIYTIYEIAFRKDIFTNRNGKLNSDILVNYFVISIDCRKWLDFQEQNSRLKQLPELSTIVDDNIDKLYLKDKEPFKELINAYEYYYQGMYEDALDCLNAYKDRGRYRTVADKLHIRSLMLRIYFEQGDFIRLDNFNRLFRYFLDKNSAGFSRAQIESHRNLIRLTKDIQDTKPSKEFLLECIENEELLACRSWLKIQLLKSKTIPSIKHRVFV